MDLQETIKAFPNSPGIYRMKNERGTILYIGKAKDLKKRVQSYWSKAAQDRYQIEFLLKKVRTIDCIVTDTEKEALILENTLIKKHKPKYNIDLRDDKTFPSIKLSIKDEYPRIYYTREIKQDGGLYYGPYASAFACKQVIDFIERYFQLRTCSDHELNSRKRPCIQYQIHRCSAPCVGYIDPAKYREIVQEVHWLLEGKSKELRTVIREHMEASSETRRYEDAARYRDLLRDLDKTMEQQKMVSHRGEEQDFIGLYREGEPGMIAVLMIRDGKVSETRWFPFKRLVEDVDVIESFLMQYYDGRHYTPPEIYVQIDLPNGDTLEEHLSEIAGRRLKLKCPRRGDKRELLSLAMRNAREAFRRRSEQAADREETLQALQQNLRLDRLPRRMECFDISNIQGKQAVGSMVRFNDGQPDKTFYRRFRVRTLPEAPNDYAMMYEVLSRRFKKAALPSDDTEGKKWELPDLLVVDGGKGHLNIAQKVLQELDVLNVDLCSLAKPQAGEDRDKIFRPGRKNPILLSKNSSSLHLMMRIRDEAHRFAITYHKALRHKKMRSSLLDGIAGIGAKKKKALLRHFGSLKGVQAASVAELQAVSGMSPALAKRIYQVLK